MKSSQPLYKVKVLDFSTLLPGPLASLILAEAGAEILKIEQPGGEDMRLLPPLLGDMSAPFAALNRGKKSIFVDLKSPDVMSILRPLIESADILLEQFRPGVMERLGLDYKTVAAINPRIIYCSITGYGQTGPRSLEPGHDINYISLTGLLSLSPGTIEAPSIPPTQIADLGGGTFPAVINILLALLQRDKTGKGAYLDISMSDAMFTFSWHAHVLKAVTGESPKANDHLITGSTARYKTYPTLDQRFVACGAIEQKFWDIFCEAIQLDSKLRNDLEDTKATVAAIRAIISSEPADVWRKRFAKANCCTTVVASIEEAYADEHFKSRGLFDKTVSDGKGHSMVALPVPIAKSFRDEKVDKTAPSLGF